MATRKGVSRPADVPPETLAQLNAGAIETATLAEGLAIDFRLLLHSVAPELAPELLARVAPGEGITRRMAVAAQLLLGQRGSACVAELATHRSDTVRGWAAYAIAQLPGLTLAERLERVRPLADDAHFAVREWAWLALRPQLAAEIEAAIVLLAPWTADPSPFVRRFAIESTRPRGVWSAHIALLKTTPELGLPLLEPVRSDEARYVQDSVSNWLNDAAKSQPEWVRALCRRWQAESPSRATQQICGRALRSIGGAVEDGAV